LSTLKAGKKEEILSPTSRGFLLLYLIIHFLWVSKNLAPKLQLADVKSVSENRQKKRNNRIFRDVTFSALLATFGCFMIGCCGSPIAIVYINMFGSSYLNVAKPLIFVITLVSIVNAYRKWQKTQVVKIVRTVLAQRE